MILTQLKRGVGGHANTYKFGILIQERILVYTVTDPTSALFASIYLKNWVNVLGEPI